MEPTQALQEMYRERLAGLSNVLRSLPEMVAEDEAVRQLATMPALGRYCMDRILELTNNLLHDEKQLTIIAVLEAMHRAQTQQQRLQELLSSEKHLRRQVEEQLEHSLGKKWRKESTGYHQFSSSNDLNQQPIDQSSAEKLIDMKLHNDELEREVMALRSQLYQTSSRAGKPVEFEQQKLELEVEQLKELRQYLLGELKKNQIKFSEKQLQCDSLQQRQAVLEQQNCALAAGIRRLNVELEHSKLQSGQPLNKSMRLQNGRLAQQLQDAQMKQRLQIQTLNDTISRMRHVLEQEKDALHRQIRNLKELQHQHLKSIEDKNSELRRFQEEADRLKQRDDKSSYEAKLKSEQLQRCEAELEMKRKQINKLVQIFEEERRGYEAALKQQESTRKGPDRRRNHKQSYFSPQRRQPAHRTMSRFGQKLDSQEFQEVNEEISRLESELNNLRSGFHAAKQRTKQSIDQSLHQLRRGILTLRRAIQKIIRLTQQQTFKMVRQLEGKARQLLADQRSDSKLKVEKVKQLCEQQIALIVEKAKMEQEQRQAEHAQIRRELAEKEGHLRGVQTESHKTKLIIEASEHLEQSYNTLIKQYDDLSKKYQLLANPPHSHATGMNARATTRSPQTRSQSPQPQSNGYIPYPRQKSRQLLADRQIILERNIDARAVDLSHSQQREKSFHSNSGTLGKTRQNNLRPDPRKEASPNKSRQTEPRLADPTLRKLEDSSNVLNNSRRVQLENGFNQLEDQIEAIIQRRNKRSNKYLK